MKFTRKSLIKLSKEFYSESELELALAVYDEVEALSLDENSKLSGFLCNVDISDPKKFEVVSSKFSDSIINNIKLIKRISSISFPETNRQIENLRKLFINLTDDLLIIFIKLAERLAALKIADKLKSDDVLRQSEEALYLYSPIAHRLGIRKIYNEMEEIAFKYLYPKEYKRLNTLIESKRTLYERKIAVMKNDLNRVLKDHKIEASIQSRVKRLYSIFLKIKNKGVSIDEIYDLLALRIITNKLDSCYLTLGVVHSNWIPIEGRFKDWITFPKPNGYRSIQTTVHTRKGDKYEIQIRTEEMHSEAEYGSAAHWAYKEGGKSNEDQSIMKLKEFLENDDYFEDPFQLLETINSEMKRETINVLTPNGDIRTLTSGSTPIDFAFTIHTDLGYKITGARINGKFGKLSTTLKSGDVVDIISNKNSTPSRDWLRTVKSSRAKSKIMRWFKNNERDILVLDGKRAYERLKKKYKKQIRGFDDDVTFRKNIEELGFNNTDEFFFGISCNNVKCSRNLLKKIYPDAFIKKIDRKTDFATKSRTKSSPPVIVDGLSGIKTTLAKCCHPMVGEDIVAYVSIKSDIRIHRKNCKHLYSHNNIDYERIKKAKWSNTDYIQSAKLKLLGENFDALLLEAVELASKESISVLSSNRVKGHEDLVGIMLEIEVKNIKQLNGFLNSLRKSPRVISFKII